MPEHFLKILIAFLIALLPSTAFASANFSCTFEAEIKSVEVVSDYNTVGMTIEVQEVGKGSGCWFQEGEELTIDASYWDDVDDEELTEGALVEIWWDYSDGMTPEGVVENESWSVIKVLERAD